VILENNGYKVGVIGVIGHNLESSISYDMVKDYEFLQPYTIVQKHSKTLREELDCNLVLVATHNYDEGEINNYLSLPYESRIDGIITGHTHQKISRSIPHNNDYNLPIIQCDDKNETVGQIIINMDKNGNPVDSSIEHYLPEKYLSDQDFTVLINKYSDEINEGNRVIGYTTEMLYWDRLGKEMTNAMMERYAGDVAFINTGGVRATISTGNIRICDVFEVFPFDNIIVITSIRGDKLLSLYQEQKKYLYFNSSFDPADINSYSYYDIVTIDYVYTGSYYQKYFQNSSRVDRELMRDVFIEYLEEFYGN
jgi:2',3'-cyclic-nucleotide 2'-phosphodiesterase (5'-nucleotidase family)